MVGVSGAGPGSEYVTETRFAVCIAAMQPSLRAVLTQIHVAASDDARM